MHDYLTTLSGDKPSAKQVTLAEDGSIRVAKTTTPYLHSVESCEVRSLSDLHSLLTVLQSQAQKFVIRGQLCDGISSEGIRRTKKAKGQTPASFKARPRNWVMLDVDDVKLPAGTNDIDKQAEDIVGYVVSLLPAEFQKAACVYQWSGSMGFKTDLIRVHLWYWLDRPLTDKDLQAWLSGFPVDKALFDPIQPHLTANPILGEGVLDPITRRVGLFAPEGSSEIVLVPDKFPVFPSLQGAKPNRHVSSSNTVDPQGIVRDGAGLVVDGRERFLFFKSLDATKELMIGKKTNDALPTPDDIAKRTWELFADGADTSDGKWSPDHAAKEAIRRHQELEEGTYGFVARNDTITLLPCLEPYTSLSIVTKEEGQQRLDTALTNFFRNIDEGPRLALRITMGAGKTRQTLKHLQRYLAGQRDQRIEIYVPRHDLAEQYVDDIQSLDGSFDAEVVHILPRVSVDTAKFPDLCKRSDYARSLNAAGLGVFQNACRSNDGERCEYYDECPYIQQFIKPELAPSTRGNVVYILVHSYLGLPRNPLQREPDLVVIDEAFLDVLVDTDTTLDPSDVRKYIKTDKLPTLGRLIVDALEDDQPLLLELRNNDIKPGDLAAVCLDDLLPNVPFTARGNRPVDRSGNSALHRSLSLLLNILQEELALVPNQDAVERLVYVPDQNKIRVSHLKELDFTDSTPILCLDATADAVLLEEILESVQVEQINVHQNAVVTQVFDVTGSKAFWDGNTAPVETLVEVANLWTSFGDPSLIVCHKGLSERLQADEKKNPDVKVMHLGNLRGSNAAEDCSVIFLTGRNLPPMAEIDLKARAFFWSAAVPLQHDAGAQFKQSSRHDHMPVHRLRGFVQSCRNKHPQSGVYVKSFSDDRIDALLAQSRDAETMQALGRLRLVHSKTRKQVFLLSNLPVEMPVDGYIKFNDLMPDALELELIRRGNIPLSPLSLSRLRPDIITSSSAAKKVLQRSNVTDPSRLRAVPTLMRHTGVVLEFEAKNAGRWNTHRHLFLMPKIKEERLDGVPQVSLSVGSIPMDEWQALLEQGYPDVPGSLGWGAIRNPRLVFA